MSKLDENQKEEIQKNENQKPDSDNENSYLKSLEEELLRETFLKSEQDFSPEKIDHLLKLMEMEDPMDDQEIEEARLAFEKQYKADHKDRIRRDKIKKYCNRMAGVAAVLMLVFMAADMTTKAVMDESLFHMVSRWTNQLEVIPGKVEKESLDVLEEEARYFNTIEEFADYFGDDFLVCSWLPEDALLNEIQVNNSDENQVILWEYSNSKIKDWKIEVWMHQGVDNATAGVVGTLIEEDRFEVKEINGNKVTYFYDNDSLLAGFNYTDWWYLIHISPYDENTLTCVLKGMTQYEKIK